MSNKMLYNPLPALYLTHPTLRPHARQHDNHAPAILRSFLILSGRVAGAGGRHACSPRRPLPFSLKSGASRVMLSSHFTIGLCDFVFPIRRRIELKIFAGA